MMTVAGLLTPSDIGTAVSTDGSVPRFVLGWSWQLPVSALVDDRNVRHRILGGIDWQPNAENAWRGRVGYRYGRRHVFGGAGVGLSGAGTTLSPEIGVKFWHVEERDRNTGIDPSLHLLARADIAPDSGHVRGGTLLLGWNLL